MTFLNYYILWLEKPQITIYYLLFIYLFINRYKKCHFRSLRQPPPPPPPPRQTRDILLFERYFSRLLHDFYLFFLYFASLCLKLLFVNIILVASKQHKSYIIPTGTISLLVHV